MRTEMLDALHALQRAHDGTPPPKLAEWAQKLFLAALDCGGVPQRRLSLLRQQMEFDRKWGAKLAELCDARPDA